MSEKENVRIYDISLPLHAGIPVWPGDPLVAIQKECSLRKGDKINLSRITMSLHWGTHVDAPYHFYENGWRVDQIPLEVLVGKAHLIEVKNSLLIDKDHLQKYDLHGVKRLLVKTRNSNFWSENPLRFHHDYTAFTSDAARYLIQLGIQLVGIDYLSIDLYSNTEYPAHRILLRENIVVIEGLDLRGVKPGIYDLYCLPLKIKEADGAPARILLKELIR